MGAFRLLLTFTVVFVGICYPMVCESSPCGDWSAFKEETCLKVVHRADTQSKQDADLVCRAFNEELKLEENDSDLVKIDTQEKQAFLQKFLFVEHAIVDNVWLGLDMEEDNALRWNDGTDLSFTNWSPLNASDSSSGRRCVQMESGEGMHAAGLWVRANCHKRNVVVCERTQPWSATKLQNALFRVTMKLENHIEEAKEELSVFRQNAHDEISVVRQQANKAISELKKKNDALEIEISAVEHEAEDKIIAAKQEADRNLQIVKEEANQKINALLTKNEVVDKVLNNLKQNPVPVGFMYFQLPGMPSPTSLWPQSKWRDVSSSYEGLFFRVAGGESAPFGQVQEGASPSLTQVDYLYSPSGKDYFSSVSVPPDGSWSQSVFTGMNAGSVIDYWSLRFRLSSVEVRPRNQAIIIWQRL